MKQIKIFLCAFLIMGCAVNNLVAQQGNVVAGGEATGSGGTMSFSTGQTDFMYFSSETGSIQFGLQQVFFFEEVDPEVPLILNLTTANLFQDEDQCFDATQTIILAGGGDTFIVQDGTGVDLIAGYSILMLPGTKVKHGGYMHARITSSEGPFCDVEEPIVASIQVYEPDNESYEEPLSKQYLDDPNQPFFTVYPNPTTGDFTLELLEFEEQSNIQLEIFSAQGLLVSAGSLAAQRRHNLTLADKHPGFYIIRVTKNQKMGFVKIIKQ